MSNTFTAHNVRLERHRNGPAERRSFRSGLIANRRGEQEAQACVQNCRIDPIITTLDVDGRKILWRGAPDASAGRARCFFRFTQCRAGGPCPAVQHQRQISEVPPATQSPSGLPCRSCPLIVQSTAAPCTREASALAAAIRNPVPSRRRHDTGNRASGRQSLPGGSHVHRPARYRHRARQGDRPRRTDG